MSRSALLLCLALAAGCTDFPQLDAVTGADEDAVFPTLLPMDGLLARAAQPGPDDTVGVTLTARAAALRRKAAILRSPVLSLSEQRRLLAAAARNPG